MIETGFLQAALQVGLDNPNVVYTSFEYQWETKDCVSYMVNPRLSSTTSSCTCISNFLKNLVLNVLYYVIVICDSTIRSST